jgi:hypothetical protein
MEHAMEVMQAMEKHAEHSLEPEVKLLDCSQAPEVLALGNLSDAQLIDLLRSDPGNALYLIAFYHLHAGLVRALLASEGKSENLNRWVWFSAFRTLSDSQKPVIPVAGWLGRIVALSLIHRELPPVQGNLPIPLSWYLYQSLEMMPIPLRITAVMGGIAKSTNKEISQFFHLRQMPLSITEVEQLRNESHRFFVDRIPVDVRRLYFGDPLDVDSPIQMLPSLAINVQEEIQHFERWHGVQVDDAVPPVASSTRTNELGPNGKSTKNSLDPVLLGLLLIAGGVAPLFALVSGLQQPTASPTPSASNSIPVVTVLNSESEPGSATIPSTKPDLISKEGNTILSATSDSSSVSTTVVSSVEPKSVSIDKRVASRAESVPEATASSPKPTATTVVPQTESVPSPATVSTATTIVPKTKPVPNVAVTPDTKPIAVPAPVMVANDQLPLLDDAPRNRPPRFFAVLVADPQKKRLLSVKRFEPSSYYRSLQGQSWIQVGAYNTLAKANGALQEFKARGFTVVIGRT